MKFCQNCNNTCIIVKFSTIQQQLQTNTPTELSDTSSDTESSKSNKIINKKDMNNIEGSKAYFRCTNCDFYELVEEDTLILYRTNMESKNDYYNINKTFEMVYDKTLPHTRNYICPNKTCISHSDYETRDAVWFKPLKSNYYLRES